MNSMITIILPGYSKHNKEWAMQTAEKLTVEGEVWPILWEHWRDFNITFSPAEKTESILTIIRNNKVNIIAKSIGTLVAMHLIQKIPEQIGKVILCGLPLTDIDAERKKIYQEALIDFPPERLFCIQNEGDPHGSFSQAVAFLRAISPAINIIGKPQGDHEYFYIDEFQKFLLND